MGRREQGLLGPSRDCGDRLPPPPPPPHPTVRPCRLPGRAKPADTQAPSANRVLSAAGHRQPSQRAARNRLLFGSFRGPPSPARCRRARHANAAAALAWGAAPAGNRVRGPKVGIVDLASVRHRWSDELAPPTMADAQRAAEALSELGAARVLLYGSVAAGTQRCGSDIDLVAVFDDLDRSEVSRDRLCEQARAAAGCEAEVEVFVTDRPEWAHRTRSVASSFEAHIAPAAIVLFDRPAPPGAVRWRKKISRPADDRSEGLSKLGHAARLVAGFDYKLTLLGTPDDGQDGGTAKGPAADRTADRADEAAADKTADRADEPAGHRTADRADDAGQDGDTADSTADRADETAAVRILMGLCYDAAMAARLSVGAVVALKGRYPQPSSRRRPAGRHLGPRTTSRWPRRPAPSTRPRSGGGTATAIPASTT